MPILDAIARFLPAPRLTKTRIALALLVALGVDGLQIAVGPLGWLGVVQVLDAIACVLTCILLGFHLLLLPTFLLELFPVVDMLPTWTGCVALVIALRRKAAAGEAPPVQTTVASLPSSPAKPPLLPPPSGGNPS